MVIQRSFTNSEPGIEDDGSFRFVISDETVDRYGTVIPISAWRLENYKQNPVVAYNHLTGSRNPDNIIGRGEVWIEGSKLKSKAHLEPAELNPMAEKVRGKLKFGSLKSVSVGFNPITWTMGDKSKGEDPNILYFREVDLLEFSIVDIPANPNANEEKDFSEFVRMAKEEATPIEQLVQESKETQEAKADPYLDRFYTLRLQCIQ